MQNILNRNITLNELIFYVYIIVLIGAQSFLYKGNTTLLGYFYILALLIGFFKVILTSYSLREFVCISLIMAVSLIVFFKTKRITVLIVAISIVGAKNIDIKKILQLIFWIKCFVFILVVLGSFVGITQNRLSEMYRISSGEIIRRYSLGFGHPNLVHIAFSGLVILAVFLFYNEIRQYHIVLLFFANVILFFADLSRTGFLTILYILLLFEVSKIKNFNKLFYLQCKILLPLCVIFCLTTSKFFGKFSILDYLNELLQTRIFFGNYILRLYPINMFGHNLGINSSLVDMGYISLFVNFGIIFSIFLLTGLFLLVLKYIRATNKGILIMLCAIFITGVTEAGLMVTYINYGIFLISDLIYRDGVEINERGHIQKKA